MFLTDFFNETRARLILLAKKGLEGTPPSYMEGNLSLSGYNVYSINEAHLEKLFSALTSQQVAEILSDNGLSILTYALISNLKSQKIYSSVNSEQFIELLTSTFQILKDTQLETILKINKQKGDESYWEIYGGGAFERLILRTYGTSGLTTDEIQIGGSTLSTGGKLRIRKLATSDGTELLILGGTDSSIVSTPSTFRSPVKFNQPLQDSNGNVRITLKPNPISSDGHIEFTGRTKLDTILIPTGAGNNKVLVSDSEGNATWQDLPTAPPEIHGNEKHTSEYINSSECYDIIYDRFPELLDARYDHLTDLLFPIGTILPFAGNIENIPPKWHICDGTNGTPDLRDKFIKGSPDINQIGTFGGIDYLEEIEIGFSDFHTDFADGMNRELVEKGDFEVWCGEDHLHQINGAALVSTHIPIDPSHYKVVYIMYTGA